MRELALIPSGCSMRSATVQPTSRQAIPWPAGRASDHELPSRNGRSDGGRLVRIPNRFETCDILRQALGG